MLRSEQVEELICLVSALDRAAVVRLIHEYDANFPLDFTSDYLDEVELDRLRHIFIAICLHCQQMPEIAEPVAA